MSKTRKDCFDEIAGRTGHSRAEVEDALDEIFNRAEGYEHDGMDRDAAYDRARDEFLKAAADDYALQRRGAILDMRKEAARHRFYKTAADAIRTLSPKLAVKAVRLALEAKLVELRYFAGLTGDQAAAVLGISPSTADRHWIYARSWLCRELRGWESPSREASVFFSSLKYWKPVAGTFM